MKESSVGGQSGGIVCNSPSPRRCCLVAGFVPDTKSWFTTGVIFLPQSVFTELLLGFPTWMSKLMRLTFTTDKTNCSCSVWHQGNIAACFDSLSSPNEETAASLQDLKDWAVLWWMSESDAGFWSGTESLSSFLNLGTPFQLVNLDIRLSFICLIGFRSYLTTHLPNSCQVDHWRGSHGAVPVGCCILTCWDIHCLQKIFMDFHDTE